MEERAQGGLSHENSVTGPSGGPVLFQRQRGQRVGRRGVQMFLIRKTRFPTFFFEVQLVQGDPEVGSASGTTRVSEKNQEVRGL